MHGEHPTTSPFISMFNDLGDRAVRVVSMTHAIMILPIAFLCLDLPELEHDRAFGFDTRAGNLYAITCGYIHHASPWSTRTYIDYIASPHDLKFPAS